MQKPPDSYADYLKSDHWQRIKIRALARSGGFCQLCGAAPTRKEPLEIHHNTYARVGHELPSDVVALCRKCHGDFHAK